MATKWTPARPRGKSSWMSSSTFQKWDRNACDSVVVPDLVAIMYSVWAGSDAVVARCTAIGSVESRMRTGMPVSPRGKELASTSGASDEPPMPHTSPAVKPSSRTAIANASRLTTRSAKLVGRSSHPRRSEISFWTRSSSDQTLGSRDQMRSTQLSASARSSALSMAAARSAAICCGRRTAAASVIGSQPQRPARAAAS